MDDLDQDSKEAIRQFFVEQLKQTTTEKCVDSCMMIGYAICTFLCDGVRYLCSIKQVFKRRVMC